MLGVQSSDSYPRAARLVVSKPNPRSPVVDGERIEVLGEDPDSPLRYLVQFSGVKAPVGWPKACVKFDS